MESRPGLPLDPVAPAMLVDLSVAENSPAWVHPPSPLAARTCSSRRPHDVHVRVPAPDRRRPGRRRRSPSDGRRGQPKRRRARQTITRRRGACPSAGPARQPLFLQDDAWRRLRPHGNTSTPRFATRRHLRPAANANGDRHQPVDGRGADHVRVQGARDARRARPGERRAPLRPHRRRRDAPSPISRPLKRVVVVDETVQPSTATHRGVLCAPQRRRPPARAADDRGSQEHRDGAQDRRGDPHPRHRPPARPGHRHRRRRLHGHRRLRGLDLPQAHAVRPRADDGDGLRRRVRRREDRRQLPREAEWRRTSSAPTCPPASPSSTARGQRPSTSGRLANGAAEIAKMAIVKDPELFDSSLRRLRSDRAQVPGRAAGAASSERLAVRRVARPLPRDPDDARGARAQPREDSLERLVDFGHVFSMELEMALVQAARSSSTARRSRSTWRSRRSSPTSAATSTSRDARPHPADMLGLSAPRLPRALRLAADRRGALRAHQVLAGPEDPASGGHGRRARLYNDVTQEEMDAALALCPLCA